MASLLRPATASYTVSEFYEVLTEDYEDHTFCGIMFTVDCKSALPVDFVEIKSISVRGRVGPAFRLACVESRGSPLLMMALYRAFGFFTPPSPTPSSQTTFQNNDITKQMPRFFFLFANL